MINLVANLELKNITDRSYVGLSLIFIRQNQDVVVCHFVLTSIPQFIFFLLDRRNICMSSFCLCFDYSSLYKLHKYRYMSVVTLFFHDGTMFPVVSNQHNCREYGSRECGLNQVPLV
jgi:hypothetical protein